MNRKFTNKAENNSAHSFDKPTLKCLCYPSEVGLRISKCL